MSATAQTRDPIATTEGCRYCWMCRHVCPVGHVTRRETLTPHGWALTIASVRRGTIRWDAETADVLYQCADCGMCQTHCVTNQPLPDAIAAARAEVAAAGTAPAAVYAAHDVLKTSGNAYGEPVAQALQAQGEIGLFISDAARRSPETVQAAEALLKAAGIAYVPVGTGRSNGLLASALGFPETAASLGRAILEDVARAGCRTLLVLAPRDRFAFSRLYPERLGLAWPDGVEVVEVTAALADALRDGRLRFRPAGEPSRPYVYQEPDHAPRVRPDGAGPRALLAAALGESAERRLFWRDRRAHPTGAVGALPVTHPALAGRLAAARFEDAAAAGASLLVTEDPAALQHLRRHQAGGIEVAGLYELLHARLAA
ncbi:MAG TPA: (Fe-S)-binding protein [Vicinamibacterales bacterium]